MILSLTSQALRYIGNEIGNSIGEPKIAIPAAVISKAINDVIVMRIRSTPVKSVKIRETIE
jgi:hypothetical protein